MLFVVALTHSWLKFKVSLNAEQSCLYFGNTLRAYLIFEFWFFGGDLIFEFLNFQLTSEENPFLLTQWELYKL